jgi:isocitrate dehydrogenase kinase/phosphatase
MHPPAITDPAGACASALLTAFAAYHAAFNRITRRAKTRFERREWPALHRDSEERLDLYNQYVARARAALGDPLPTPVEDGAAWQVVKARFTTLITERDDADIAASFFNSVTMRLAPAAGIDPRRHFAGGELDGLRRAPQQPVYRSCPPPPSMEALVCDLLAGCGFSAPFADLAGDAARAGRAIECALTPGARVESVEVAQPVFYRGQGAYVVGRIRTSAGDAPLALALRHEAAGIYVDAVLLTTDEVSIIFSFARSYFHVEVEDARALAHFLKAILPLKPIAELYISLGYNKHGKTELYRDLMRHLAQSSDKFVIAPGARGMVMVVFTLPSYDVVFKIIKDHFDYPKTTTRRDVIKNYQLVFRHDRGGRLIDAQEFEHLRFARDRFDPDLLAELLEVAADSVSVEGDAVVIRHLYTERRITPLNLYIHEAPPDQAAAAVIDYGQTMKDLAATNIFPGDMLLKNFGVTRHGRVVFYDYDELCLLTDCVFRQMPAARDSDEDVYAEPWFAVDENDVFPEELSTFLGLPGGLRDIFVQTNGELFGVEFWTELQRRHRAGEVIDIFPYQEGRRLARESA